MIRQLWQSLLERLERDNPQASDIFNGGATELEIEAFEHALGWPLPDQMREWYQIVNGQTRPSRSGPILTMRFMSLEEMRSSIEIFQSLRFTQASEVLTEPIRSIPPEYVQEVFVGEGWIPFAENAGSGYLVLDLNPGPLGVPGQVFSFDFDFGARCVVTLALADLLAWIIDLFDEGRMTLFLDQDADCDYGFQEAGIASTSILDTLREMALEGRLEARFEKRS